VAREIPELNWMVELLVGNLRWISDEISDETLFDLLLWSDVFALPAMGLHSYSALRAMKFGSVLICSDIPGYDEYIEHGKSALVVSGIRDAIYQFDSDTGCMLSDYNASVRPNPRLIHELLTYFLTLSENSDMRYQIASAAYYHVSTAHAIEPWVRGSPIS
jgi:glycosyltransferase involved in cell wall biosynthesis